MDEEEVYVEVKVRLSSFIGQVMDDDGLLTMCARVESKPMSMPCLESPVTGTVRDPAPDLCLGSASA